MVVPVSTEQGIPGDIVKAGFRVRPQKCREIAGGNHARRGRLARDQQRQRRILPRFEFSRVQLRDRGRRTLQDDVRIRAAEAE